eukprot:jgi/Pico_ML_1/51979/g2762.t1
MASPYARCPPLVDLEVAPSRGNADKQRAIEARLRRVPTPSGQERGAEPSQPPPGFGRAMPTRSVDDWIDARDDDEDEDDEDALDTADWPHDGDGWDP